MIPLAAHDMLENTPRCVTEKKDPCPSPLPIPIPGALVVDTLFLVAANAAPCLGGTDYSPATAVFRLARSRGAIVPGGISRSARE
jgi:hypothetical protein